MKIQSNKVLLFIEPEKDKSPEPLIDELTIKMFNSLKNNIKNTGCVSWNGHFNRGLATMGIHECICGKQSTNCDYILENGIATNYLCVHYLAYHREEVSTEELEKVKKLNTSNILLEEDDKKFKMTL
jgi:hypothetical protein